MGRDCEYCGAYISDMVEVCPACGKRFRPEKTSTAEHWTGSYTAGAASRSQYAGQSGQSEQQQTGPNAQTYTYKQEYERRYGAQQGSGAYRRPGQQAEPRSAGYRPGEQTHPHHTTTAQYASSEDEDIRRSKGISFLSYFGPLFFIPYIACRDSEFARFHSNQGLLLFLANIIVNFCAVAVPIIGWLISVIGSIFVVCGFISGLMNVYKGLKKPLPIIGEISILR